MLEASRHHDQNPLISVIVPVWNDEKRISSCLEALLAQSLPANSFEILVVDNGSTDDTVLTALRYPRVRVLSETRPGSYAARNMGLSHANGTYVAFTDSDCIPDPDWLATGLAALTASADVGVAAGQIIFNAPEGDYSSACLNYERYLSMRQDRSTKLGYAITANWFSPRNLLLEWGGFDANLKSGGDYALSHKIFSSGKTIAYVPDAVIRHPARAQVDEMTGKIRRVVGGRWAAETRSMKTLRRAKVETRNFIDRVKIIRQTYDLASAERIKLLFLITQIWVVSINELARLQFGGVPKRS